MPERAALLLALSAVACSSACAPSPRPAPPRTEVTARPSVGAAAPASPPEEAAESPAAAPRLSFRVSARFPATIVYALDRATASGGADPRYRRWLFGDAAAPEWFDAYAARRGNWDVYRDSRDGPYNPYAACSFEVDTLDALLECATPLLEAGDLEVARDALQQTAALLRPRWAELEPILSQQRQDLQALTGGAQGTGLARVLASTARLPEREQLTFEVVLVARPPGDVSRANQSGTYLVVEAVEQKPASHHAHVLFHELAHLAVRHAPGREALEQVFVGRGLPGLVAANLWEEAFATAFGNGLAARELDPTFRPERSLYNDAGIDGLGRALYLRWAAGTPITVDATLGEQMLQLVDSSWPRARWRMLDVFGRLLLLSEEREAVPLLRQGLHPRLLQGQVPLPADLTFLGTLTPPVPRVVVASLATLQTRPDVLQLFELDADGVRSRLSAHGPSLYCLDDDDPRVLITARTRDDLLEAVRAFAVLQQPPGPGWTELPGG